MSDRFIRLGYKVVTGGTDNHMFLLDLSNLNITGLEVQDMLDEHNITLNKNMIPNDKRTPKEASGVRIGTPAMTTKGYVEEDFIRVADEIDRLIKEYIKQKEANESRKGRGLKKFSPFLKIMFNLLTIFISCVIIIPETTFRAKK